MLTQYVNTIYKTTRVSTGLLMRSVVCCCVLCLSGCVLFSLHRWVAQQWVKRKQSTTVLLASIYPLSSRASKLAMHGN